MKRMNGLGHAGRLVDEHQEKSENVFADQALCRIEHPGKVKALLHDRVKAIGVEDLP